MIRKFTRAGSLLAATLGILAALLAASPSATAATSAHICLAFGNGACVGAPTLNNGDPVELTADGRQINLLDQNFTCCGGLEVYRLQLAAAPSLCLGQTQFATVTLRNCSGGDASLVNWALSPQADGTIEFINRPNGGVLTSPGDQLGTQLTVTSGCNGCFLKWIEF
jgi:hypothetical protein